MRHLKSPNPENNLLNTISYFTFFDFAPSFDEIVTFFPKKIGKKALKLLLDRLVRQKRLIMHTFQFSHASKGIPPLAPLGRNDNIDCYNNINSELLKIENFKLRIDLYTLPQYIQYFKYRAIRQSITQKKLVLIDHFMEILKKVPFIQFVGVTGSASMGNCKDSDDVDLFIITSKKLLFIGRFVAILLSCIMNVRKGKNSVCLNLFFSEDNLLVPKTKRTSYVAHEVLQIKPIINKNNAYERFIKMNKWVTKIFPNSLNRHYRLSIRHPDRPACRQGRSGGIPLLKRFLDSANATLAMTVTTLLYPLEIVLKQIQLTIIRKNKTGLIITSTQLWLFRRDFEKKIHSKLAT